MLTIIDSKTFKKMLPPLDPDLLMSLQICEREREFEARFNKIAIYLGVFALLYIIMRIYAQ